MYKPIRTVRHVRVRSILPPFGAKQSIYKTVLPGMYFDGGKSTVGFNIGLGGDMKQIVKSIGDREIAWIMLAVAAVAIWSTWGIIS
jgi:hypothetical protein